MSRLAGSATTWGPIALVWVIIDQLSKQWALETLVDRDIQLVGSAEFTLSFNTGMAFGQGQGVGPVIGVLALFVIAGIVISLGRHGSRLMQIAVGLIVGGAIGNVLDRVFREPGWFEGAVVDFIRVFDWFPIFNVADIGITVGGALMLIASWVHGRHEPDDATTEIGHGATDPAAS